MHADLLNQMLWFRETMHRTRALWLCGQPLMLFLVHSRHLLRSLHCPNNVMMLRHAVETGQ